MGAAAVFSGIHVAAVFAATFPAATAIWLFPLFFLLPGLLTMILLPGAWRYWYRWLVLAFLCVTVVQDALALVLFTGQAWALYRSWFLERTVPLAKLFSPRKGAKTPVTTRTSGGPTTVAEALAAEKTGAPVRKPGSAKAGAASRKAAVQAAKSATVRNRQ